MDCTVANVKAFLEGKAHPCGERAVKRCVIISDSFKGTLSSLEICKIARETIPAFLPGCQVEAIPVADGGEGMVDCFAEAVGAEKTAVSVHGPHGEVLTACYGRKGPLAIVEMAAAAGLPLVGEIRDPEKTTTFGVGELIRHAVEHGCREIMLGLGGSATNDGGCGCAAALGAVFYNAQGEPFVPVGGTLGEIERIDLSGVRERLDGVRLTAMCDVDNPLCGPNGAACVFAPQKGADAAMVERLDRGLCHLDSVLQRTLGHSFAGVPGAGAAGGMGAGCLAFLGGRLRSGIEAVLDAVEFDRRLEGADFVITGEGRIDSQSFHGKVLSGVARRTRERNIPLIAIGGGILPEAEEAYKQGVTAMFSINRQPMPLRDSAPCTAENYRRTLEDICRLLAAFY